MNAKVWQKTRGVLLHAFVLASFVSGAGELTVSGLSVRQLWPWSENVAIDFSIDGDSGCDVVLKAFWDGCSEGVVLSGDALTGRTMSIKGQCHCEWNPAVAGYGGRALTGFNVSVEPVSPTNRTYLVVDLTTGDCEYLAEVPSGGWTDAHKRTKLVFRRCPAGTYKIGDEWYTVAKPCGAPSSIGSPRTVTLTSDFYIGIYPLTLEQYYQISGGSHYAGEWESYPDTLANENCSYNAMRGTNTVDGRVVSWPQTKYEVATNSFLGKLRAKTAAKGHSFVFDLPEEEQWEVAARAGVTTTFQDGEIAVELDKSGGYSSYKVTNSEALWTVVNRFTYSKNHPWYNSGSTYCAKADANTMVVGCLEANKWGIYDMAGSIAEWTLDVAEDASRPNNLTDPTGPLGKGDGTDLRRARSYRGSQISTLGFALLSARPALKDCFGPAGGNGYVAPRIAIHLNPLDFDVR